jgi:hypothetical protein
LARRSLKPQLNQIRTWVRQGRTDAWIAHQLEVSVREIASFKREHELAPDDASGESALFGPRVDDEVDLRAEDEALVAAALEEEARTAAERDEDEGEGEDDEDEDEGADRDGGDDDSRSGAKKRRRGRRGGRGRKKGSRQPLEGTFDHGDDGYGLWLDPTIQDDPLYAEHWAGHRAVKVTVEQDRIVIERSGSESS